MEGGDRGWGLGWALLRPGRFSEGPGRTIHLKTALSGLSSSNNRVSKLRLMTMTMTVSRRDILEIRRRNSDLGGQATKLPMSLLVQTVKSLWLCELSGGSPG